MTRIGGHTIDSRIELWSAPYVSSGCAYEVIHMLPLERHMGQFPQDGNLALQVAFFWFTFMRSCIHKFAPKHFLKVLGQNSGLLNPKNVKKKF